MCLTLSKADREGACDAPTIVDRIAVENVERVN
jgi:hypothetical protein